VLWGVGGINLAASCDPFVVGTALGAFAAILKDFLLPVAD